jgi:hypothetical protein
MFSLLTNRRRALLSPRFNARVITFSLLPNCRTAGALDCSFAGRQQDPAIITHRPDHARQGRPVGETVVQEPR